ncbi:PREDICTED: uncharacterized protein LOC105584930 [Cercocebus atys]|uniref:uncharacterized protein LOC105584930 n=1 Tax=Cercocebus atys TaxID=9531 RepID=UPI0005F5744F|nr:PREDICTED: uncharacterized protein LOC105584930 [Cercocebus atys]
MSGWFLGLQLSQLSQLSQQAPMPASTALLSLLEVLLCMASDGGSFQQPLAPYCFSAPSLGGEYMVLHRGRGLWPWYLPSQKITRTPGSHSLFRSEPRTALSTRWGLGAFPVFYQRRFWFLMTPTCMQITCQQGVDGNWNRANFTFYCDPTTLGLPSNPLPSKVVSQASVEQSRLFLTAQGNLDPVLRLSHLIWELGLLIY